MMQKSREHLGSHHLNQFSDLLIVRVEKYVSLTQHLEVRPFPPAQQCISQDVWVLHVSRDRKSEWRDRMNESLIVHFLERYWMDGSYMWEWMIYIDYMCEWAMFIYTTRQKVLTRFQIDVAISSKTNLHSSRSTIFTISHNTIQFIEWGRFMNNHQLNEVKHWNCESIQTILFKTLLISSIFPNPLYMSSINAELLSTSLILNVPRNYLHAIYVKL